jgi:hypothetical protein
VPLKLPRRHNFQYKSINRFKMSGVQTSEVNAKRAPVSLGLSRFKLRSHCSAAQESTVVKHWVSLLEPIVERRACATVFWDQSVQNWTKTQE